MFTFDLSSTRRIRRRSLHVIPAEAGLMAHDDHVRRVIRRLHPDAAFAPVYIRPRDGRLAELAIAWYTSAPLMDDAFLSESHLIVCWSIRTAGRTLREAVLAGLPGLRWEDHAADHSEWLDAWFTRSKPSP